MKQKIMGMYKRFKFKIKLRYKYSLINRIAECLYAISSKKRRETLDYYITKLFNPKLAKEIEEMTANMIAQSNEDTNRAAQLIESCRGTPNKILNSRGVLLPSEIVPEFTMAQKAMMASVQKLLDTGEGFSIPVIDNDITSDDLDKNIESYLSKAYKPKKTNAVKKKPPVTTKKAAQKKPMKTPAKNKRK